MCGRYSIGNEIQDLSERYKIDMPAKFQPSYNAAPGQQLPVVSNQKTGVFSHVHWGIKPFWAKDESKRLINARAETVDEKATFKKSFRQRRCLVAADGYYEWMKSADGKIPYRITRRDTNAFFLAGVWDTDQEGQPCYAIITTEASPSVTNIHERMPVILTNEALDFWNSDTEDYEGLLGVLRPFDDKKLEAYAVSKKVNWVGNNYEDLRAPV